MNKCNCGSNEFNGGLISKDTEEKSMFDNTHYLLIGCIILLLLLIKSRC